MLLYADQTRRLLCRAAFVGAVHRADRRGGGLVLLLTRLDARGAAESWSQQLGLRGRRPDHYPRPGLCAVRGRAAFPSRETGAPLAGRGCWRSAPTTSVGAHCFAARGPKHRNWGD